jgi:hypothetical protein
VIMSELDPGMRDNPIAKEVDLIMGDLMTEDDGALNIGWTAVPLQEDDTHWNTHPEYLADGSPRYIVVTLNLGSMAREVVADAASAPGFRDHWIAEAFQDELCDETRELRPLCPVHSGKTPRILVPMPDDDWMVWQCNEDKAVRCNLGSYWQWRRSFSS